MKLNSKGFAPWSLLIAAGVVVLTTIVLVLPRSNEYADIDPMKASRRTLSDSDKVTLKSGEEYRILGIKKSSSKKTDYKQTPMLLIQNSRGERDLFHIDDLITDEKFQELLPDLKKHEFSNSNGLFCRKTLTRKAIDAIPLGISLEEMDKILSPTDRVYTEDGFQNAKYLRMEVFDKKTGRFYEPTMKFKDGKYCGCILTPDRKTHMNAWLLRILPGAEWVYDHNVFNIGSQKKGFSKADLREKETVTAKDNFLVWLMMVAIAILLFVAIFAFYAFIPMLPAYTFYGLLLFPPLFKPFNETLTRIAVITLTVLGYYYCWLTFMPYMSYFLMPVIMIPAAIFAIEQLLCDEICRKCRYMNRMVLDHQELIKQYITNRTENKTRRIGSRKTGSHKTWKETTYREKNQTTGEVLREYTNKSDEKNFTDYEDTYRTDSYNCIYHVKVYKKYYMCEVCGDITTSIGEEWELMSKDYKGSSTSTSTRTEQD